MSLPCTTLSTVYADESDDKTRFVLAFVNVPTAEIVQPEHDWDSARFLNKWESSFASVIKWRQYLRDKHGIPVAKELKGRKLAKGQNRYKNGNLPLYGPPAIRAYKDALDQLAFLPDQSIFSICATRGFHLYGYYKLEACLNAAFQRIETQNKRSGQKSLLMFDEGHGEYRTLFRKACRYLPTGSRMGGWSDGTSTANKPLSTSIEDVNFKDSRQSHFIQIADLIAYATLLKVKSERSDLTEKEKRLHLGSLHDAIPRNLLNTKVHTGGTDGIKRLG
ncbi:DUF3800 domain-containing protein [Roseovarius sp. B08]|uniref:DUF3800 domain-containing protein n=1 Tax=Roseovarius sp. B08 TaxID=3449223 RepID=UPI003EDC9133